MSRIETCNSNLCLAEINGCACCMIEAEHEMESNENDFVVDSKIHWNKTPHKRLACEFLRNESESIEENIAQTQQITQEGEWN